jgi:hypothetical protein
VKEAFEHRTLINVECILIAMDLHVTQMVKVDETGCSTPSPAGAEIHFYFVMLERSNGIAYRIKTCTLKIKHTGSLNPLGAGIQCFGFR